jgi:hypothetical protein
MPGIGWQAPNSKEIRASRNALVIADFCNEIGHERL